MTRIGLELHVRITDSQKLFCGCKAEELAKPNTHLCEVCMGEPGTIPSLNYRILAKAIRAAVLLNCRLAKQIRFYRKHYHYKDLPKAFQITMREPLGLDGSIQVYDGYTPLRSIPITHVVCQQDPAKSKKATLDYNRCGMGLIQIVTPPVLQTGAQAVAFIKTVLHTLHYAGITDKDAKTCFRADVNISSPQYARVELKNLGSLRLIEQAIVAEINRQSTGSCRTIQTRTYVPILGTTVLSRIKQSEQQYHYLPELNLIPEPIVVPAPQQTNYDYYRAYVKLWPAPRAWAYANNEMCNQLLTRYPVTKALGRKLDLAMRWRQWPVSLFEPAVSVEQFARALRGGVPTDLAAVWQQCWKDAKFRACWESQDAGKRHYVVGTLMKKSNRAYIDVWRFLEAHE